MDDPNPTLLVVDDDRLVLATLVAGLKQAGFDVIEADNGDDAILLARKFKPRLAILDMRMQGKSGMDVARYLAANTDTGFMFLSAFGDSDIVDEATRIGALGYLVKPLDVRQIVPAVRAALARTAEPGRAAAPEATPAPEPAPAAPERDRHVAIGILMERLRIDYDRAVAALRLQAQVEHKDLDALATSMVEAANRLNSIRR
ncbi:MAG: ANTAR domain-containing response regulator [Betaproteobacteria bacterium]|jgi:response regulator NasT